MTAASPLRVAVLWSRLSGYAAAALRALEADGCSVLLFHETATDDAPFADNDFGPLPQAVTYQGSPERDALLSALDSFRPDVLLVVSWHVAAFRAAARTYKNRALRVLFMDNPWLATARQRVGALVSPLYIQRLFDAVFLPGERQAEFARRLGFPPDRIWQGAYVCDVAAFGVKDVIAPPDNVSFLFSGRLVPAKGVGDLAEAWERLSARPEFATARLVVAGVGPQASLLEALPRVDHLGFVTPTRLATVMRSVSAVVLPSRHEHWGVVLNEACAAGRPIITTTAVGASPHLVRDGQNGWLVPPGRPDALERAFADVATMSGAAWLKMSDASRALGASYTPEGWASYLHTKSSRLLRDMRGRS